MDVSQLVNASTSDNNRTVLRPSDVLQNDKDLVYENDEDVPEGEERMLENGGSVWPIRRSLFVVDIAIEVLTQNNFDMKCLPKNYDSFVEKINIQFPNRAPVTKKQVSTFFSEMKKTAEAYKYLKSSGNSIDLRTGLLLASDDQWNFKSKHQKHGAAVKKMRNRNCLAIHQYFTKIHSKVAVDDVRGEIDGDLSPSGIAQMNQSFSKASQNFKRKATSNEVNQINDATMKIKESIKRRKITNLILKAGLGNILNNQEVLYATNAISSVKNFIDMADPFAEILCDPKAGEEMKEYSVKTFGNVVKAQIVKENENNRRTSDNDSADDYFERHDYYNPNNRFDPSSDNDEGTTDVNEGSDTNNTSLSSFE